MVSTIDLKALNVFVNSPVSQNMIHKLVVATLQVLPCLENQQGKSTANAKPLPSLMTFINKLVRYTNVYTGTLMATLVYLEKLKQKLPKNAQGLPCTRHRIFLSCLILASKFHNDCSPKNIHWANYTDGLFTSKDVNLMERQLLYLLNWNLRISNEEMIEQVGSFLAPIKEDLIKLAKMRRYLQKQQQAATQMKDAKERKESLCPSPVSRSSSTTSHMSLGALTPCHSRQDSAASSVMSTHYRQDSLSSLESLSPTPVQTKEYRPYSAGVDPMIELAARNEEQELSRMISQMYRLQA